MGMSASTLWWIAAGVTVAVELATGTFYLLMIAIGLVGGAIAAHLGLASEGQLVVAAVIGVALTGLWHWRRAQHPRSLPAATNRDVNLDIGERVRVDGWTSDRTAQVQYRGSVWNARLAPGAAAATGAHHIVAVEGNWLVLAPSSVS